MVHRSPTGALARSSSFPFDSSVSVYLAENQLDKADEGYSYLRKWTEFARVATARMDPSNVGEGVNPKFVWEDQAIAV
jgi:hypothetical protein